jgi:phosphoribosylaminoimidazolecarboxamide formyltransferase/IMP cyclohydrolase
VLKRALLSVSDKTGLAGFARGLVRLDYELYSTGGTLAALSEAAIEARPVSDLTGFPEMLDGRVKTLHPGVHAGLLARRDVPEHLTALAEHELQTIDLLCVNLYPFQATADTAGVAFDDVVEQIDVGGPAMVRAAAKNHEGVIVVVRPERYSDLLQTLAEGDAGTDLRRELAAEAFAHTAAYDAQIAAWLRRQTADGELPVELTIAGALVQRLAYGENPHQKAAFYRSAPDPGGLAGARLLHGPDLSFNNVQDAAAAMALVLEYEQPAAAIIKHTNPCGLAVAADLKQAYRMAYDADPLSAFGGVVAFNRPLDAAVAEDVLAGRPDLVIAPEVAADAIEVLARRKRTRVLAVAPVRDEARGWDVRSVPGGYLVQDWDQAGGLDRITSVVAGKREPGEGEWRDLDFAWRAVKHVKSNAIVIARDCVAVGIGAGQMSRVEAVQMAVERAGARARGSVLASDAFFPFPDGVEEAVRAGVTAIVQPGGSVNDDEVVAAAEAAEVAMVMTGGRRFRH